MNDRDLLERAAKAAGYAVRCVGDGVNGGRVQFYMEPSQLYWDPLGDDGDALRLAVKLNLYVRYHRSLAQALVTTTGGDEYQANVEDYGHDACKATRRAIVLAAAELGATHD